jgi:Nitrate and nitrite sensing/Histidine kinase-, DNA gyrase B-, and HSP90-like ATPase/HAMP domain
MSDDRRARPARRNLGRRTWASSIRIRVLAIVLIPSAALLITGATVTGYLVSEGQSARTFAAQTNLSRAPIQRYLTAVEQERTISLLAIGGDSQALADLPAQWKSTDAADVGIDHMLANLGGLDPQVMAAGAAASAKLLAKLPAIRQAVQAGHASVTEVDSYYTQVANVGMGTFLLYAPRTPDSTSAASMIGTMDLFTPIDLHSRAVGLGAGWAVRGPLSQPDRVELSQLIFAYRDLLSSFVPRLTPAEQAQYASLVAGSAWRTAIAGEDALAQQGKLTVPVTTWLAAEDQVSAKLFGLWSDYFAVGLDDAGAAANQKVSSSVLVGSVVLVLTLAAFSAALLLANGLVRRLRRLRTRTLELADVQLPSIVARISAGDRVDPEAEMGLLDYGSDEIGQVAEAFNAAQRTAVTAAAAEARTRGGINKVFLDIAHRSQLVVHRQLELLDVAEARQTDPEHLEMLFQLDHLATRARRNAENLLILGGGQPGRKWRRPAALEDVVRSAVSETEHFARVSTVRLPEVSVLGAVVGDLIHLLAEVVDNATAFSPPEAAVEVRGNVVGNGVVVEVEDQGLGIEFGERQRLNETLRDPMDFQAMATSGQRHLGLFVVGMLAQRHGIAVSLAESAYGGIKAIVLIPPSAVEAGSEGGRAPTVGRVGRHGQLPGAGAADELLSMAAGARHAVSKSLSAGDRPAAPATGRNYELVADLPSAPPWEISADPSSGQPRSGRAPLPHRQRQANLAPGLRLEAEGATRRAASHAAPQRPSRSPEQARGSMAAFQRGTRLARDTSSRDNR